MTFALLQSAGVIALAIVGGIIGGWFARRKSLLWLVGFILPIIPVLMIGLARRWYPLGLQVPFRWLVMGRTQFAVTAFATAVLMFTLIGRLPKARLRRMVGIFMVLLIFQACVMPFLMPGIQHNQIAALQTRITRDGVCLQSTDYTCGPAAAVTALRALGLHADEAELALLANTSRSTGTQPDMLASALQDHFAAQHLRCDYRAFTSAADLPADHPTIALIRYQFLVDHYVTVLKVGKNHLTIGDPLTGLTDETFDDFEKDWRRVGIVLSIDNAASAGTLR
jgi:predicted double-glycine peptidase